MVHYRTKQMRYDAQASGKAVPTQADILRMLNELASKGMDCPVCKRRMNWLKKEGISTIVTLQHDRDGGFRLICLACNVRHQHFDGDQFYDCPEGHKRCYLCRTVKPFSDFYPSKHSTNGLTSGCRDCSKAAVSAYSKTKRQKARAHASS